MSSTDLAERQSSELANIDALLAQRALAIANNIKVGGKHISLINRRFNLPGGVVTDGPLDFIIIDFAFHNRYYATGWQPNESSAPDCFAVGDSEETMKVGEGLPHPISNDCTTCPNNQWGSAGGGRKGKACSNHIILAVMSPDLDDNQDVMLLKTSPGAFNDIKQYLKTVTQLYGHPMKAVTKTSILPYNAVYKLGFEQNGANEDYREHAKYLDVAAELVRTPPAIPTFTAQVVKRARA